MNISEILSKVDHTLLSPAAKLSDIKRVIDEGIKYNTASVCIPPSYVKEASEYSNSRIPICTVIGFPNGYMTSKCKCFEAEDAVHNGADEIDMVINLGLLKDRKFDMLLSEIKSVKDACSGRILKVIIETCLLNDDEKIEMCRIISESGADYIKTSTGFSVSGATKEDIILFANNVAPHVKIKAAGGISTIDDAKDFISLGASRLGTSRIIKILENQESGNY